VQFKLKIILRNSLNGIVWRGRKGGSTIRDLGCSLAELIDHLSKQFTDDMSWDNHGAVWEIDHIKPLCSFDLTDRNQFIKAVHYTNLRPLYKEENNKKSHKDKAEAKRGYSTVCSN